MNFPARYKADIVSAVESLDLEKITEAIELFKDARGKRRNIFACGGAPSASAAARILCDMISRASFEKPARFRAFVLDHRASEPESAVNYENVFVEELKNFVEPGDVVLGICASENAPAILRAFEYSASIGCKIVAFTGPEGAKWAALADIAVPVGSTHYGTVEDAHVILCHMIGSYFLEAEGPSTGSRSPAPLTLG